MTWTAHTASSGATRVAIPLATRAPRRDNGTVRFGPGFLAAAVVVVSTPVAVLAAEGAGEQPDPATQLFDSGLDNMLAGRYETGCPQLAQSHQLAPKKMGTLFTLAECYAKWGRHAVAYRHYRTYLQEYEQLDPSGKQAQRQRQHISVLRLRALRKRVALVTFSTPAGSPSSPESILLLR